MAKNLKSQSSNRSIGVFDSGFGGLSIMKHLIQKLPHESIIYLGDSKNAPYGDKTREEIIKYSLEAAKFLAKQDIKILIIACNTACAYASEIIQKCLSIPVFEIITPSFQEVVKNQKQTIGIIATRATIRSKIYKKLLLQHCPSAKVFSKACPLLVPLLEEGHFDDEIAKQTVKHYLKSLKNQNIDTLLLACTHYPLMKSLIQKALGKTVNVIDPSLACVTTLAAFLKKEGLFSNNKDPKYTFYTSGEVKKFKSIAEVFLDEKIDVVLKK